MGHSRGNQRLIRSPRRTTIWNEGPLSTAVQSATAASTLVVNTGQTALGGVTLVRTRGHLAIWISSAGSDGDGFTRVQAGIGIVTTDAFAAGGSSMPTPLDDPDWGGWLWFDAVGPVIGQELANLNSGPMGQVRLPIDSKAMRKVKPNETIFGSVSFQAEIGVATINMAMDTRMLIKLS